MMSIKLISISLLALLLVFVEKFLPASAVTFLAGGLIALAVASRFGAGSRNARRRRCRKKRGDRSDDVFVCGECGYVHPQGVDFRYCPGCGNPQAPGEADREQGPGGNAMKTDWDAAPLSGGDVTMGREMSIESASGHDRPAHCPSCQYPLTADGAECGNCGWGP